MTPQEIVQEMMDHDTFSQWLGIEILAVDFGYCRLKSVVRADMLNGHKIAHGGITYSLSDSSLAFASNSHGQKCMSIETSITHLLPVHEHDTLIVECREIKKGKSFATYKVEIHNQNNELVSSFKGTVNVSDKAW